jgi:hypothetical protein
MSPFFPLINGDSIVTMRSCSRLCLVAVIVVPLASFGCAGYGEMRFAGSKAEGALGTIDRDGVVVKIDKFSFHRFGADTHPFTRGVVKIDVRSSDGRSLIVQTGDVSFTELPREQRGRGTQSSRARYFFQPIVFNGERDSEYRIDCEYVLRTPDRMEIAYLLDGKAGNLILPLVESRSSVVLQPANASEPPRGIASASWMKKR